MSSSNLAQRANYPLELKVEMSKNRIRDWYNYFGGKVYISFSGGKDSTVLLDLVRSVYPDVPAVFVDTGLEYPEIRDFVKTVDNVEWVKPEMNFNKVLTEKGVPLVSKDVAQKIKEIRNTKSEKLYQIRMHGGRNGNGKLPDKWKYLIDTDIKISDECCKIMKIRPVKLYEKRTGRYPFIGTMALESRNRRTEYGVHGCNLYSSKRPMSKPMSFWREDDVWEYIKEYELDYSAIYDMGYTRTGCMFCMFGIHMEKGENRFQTMKKTHPQQYDYCINKLRVGEYLDQVGIEY